MLLERVQLTGRNLVALEGVRLAKKGAHIPHKGARDAGRQFYRLAGHGANIGGEMGCCESERPRAGAAGPPTRRRGAISAGVMPIAPSSEISLQPNLDRRVSHFDAASRPPIRLHPLARGSAVLPREAPTLSDLGVTKTRSPNHPQKPGFRPVAAFFFFSSVIARLIASRAC
jgi:hypothetical protein